MRNENFAPYLLQPFPAPPLDEERELCLQISTLARRWAACSRFLFRPRFLYPANFLPRVNPLALILLSLFARAVPSVPPPDEKLPSHPFERGLPRGAGCARCPARPIFIPFSCLLPRVFSSVLLPLCFPPSDVERGQPVAAADSGPCFLLPLLPAPGH